MIASFTKPKDGVKERAFARDSKTRRKISACVSFACQDFDRATRSELLRLLDLNRLRKKISFHDL